ncbi:metal ABC transporter substrate-binding protein [Tessaracoccus sp. OH4464_COT-324]|uniref:metal ABC transporter substrate-binding protein n=1 Tax=Tessaracoccus sp. OH4464_COT-324 TaxID=2491059 RepID=UPI000F644AA0|nr:metal ABC transporter substrate-binding protein [Tessaracoccus sp. OH4464_COT-324]RRD45211.1 zinc ABC transporter substrate-binding protein [Tessaracoccus sp. OH4464_COT-324]
MRNLDHKFPRRAVVAALAAGALLVGCSAQQSAGDDVLDVYATTGYLADAVANIAPDARVTTMVGPGGDPHTYQPSTQDIEKMRSADVVLWTGLHMEAQMIDQLRGLGDKQLEVGTKLDPAKLLDWPEPDEAGNPLKDPHIWNDPEVWSDVVTAVGEKLGEVDKDKAKTYADNAAAYRGKIADTAKKAKDELDKLPASNRVLVTGHDAFNYFGRTFNLEVHATDFVSSEAQLSAAELSQLASMIAEKKVPVIFQDNLANPQAIESLKEAVRSKGWEVEVSDKALYADALGDTAGVDTYLGVLEYNAKTVAQALGGK